MLPKRYENSHKGTYGRVAVFGGSAGMAGSVCLASTAALKAGAGIAYAVVPDEIYEICQIKLTEVMVKRESQFEEAYNMSDVIVVGPGYLSKSGMAHIMELAQQREKPLVVDAEGLNYIKNNGLKNYKCDIVITPHPGEFARLISKTRDEINADRENLAKKYAVENGISVLLKGKNTVIADKDGTVKINTTGSNALSTAGSGDVLAGIIGGLIAQNMTAFDAAVLGAYLHGLAGDLAAKALSAYSVTACDILNYIGKAFLHEQG